MSAAPGLARAQAPASGEYNVVWYLVEQDGGRGRQMNLFDMQQYWNRARCECAQPLQVEVTRQTTAVGGNDQLTLFAGRDCDLGLDVNQFQVDPCGQLGTPFSFELSQRQSYRFDPVWLWSGPVGGTALISGSTPNRSCTDDAAVGVGGLWICAGLGSQCTDFIVTQEQNFNTEQSMSPQGVGFDFVPPTARPSNVRAEPGDGAVEVRWDLTTTGDINGFRVLCAQADGSPVPGKGIDDADPLAQSNGTVYWTKEALCPGDGQFLDDAASTTGTDSSTSDSAGTDSSTTDSSGTDSSTTDSSGTDSSTTATTDATATDTATATDGATDTDTDTDGGDPLDAGIRAMGFDYVCSSHIPANTQSARISGLENGATYRFALVAYDVFGNPVLASDVFTEIPQNTRGFWEVCEQNGNCGEPGFCSVRARGHDHGAWWLGGALLFVAGVRRRRSA
jgi:hypothetical protein